MKNLIITLALSLFCFCVFGFQVETNDCQNPLIVQYIQNFTISTQDLERIIQTNASSMPLNNIIDKQNKVNFTQIQCNLKYISGSKNPTPINPLTYNITNDSFSIDLSWAIDVYQPAVKNHHYHANATIQKLATSYIKSFSTKQNNFYIANFTYALTADMIKDVKFNDTVGPKDKQKIEKIINSTLLKELDVQIKKLEDWINDSISKQRIAITFPDDKYIYSFDKTSITINTATLNLTTNDNITFIHGIDGNIANVQGICPVMTPQARPGYKLYFSSQFLSNFAMVFLNTYPGYQNMIFNSKVKTNFFQWKLLDLEFVLDNFGEYEDKVLNDISFSCSVGPDSDFIFAANKLKVNTTWDCKGFLELDKDNSVQIIDATFQFIDNVNLYIQAGKLQVSQNYKFLSSSQYRPINGFTVKNKQQANTYVKYIVFLYPSRIFGDGFQVQSDNTVVSVEERPEVGKGIWIG